METKTSRRLLARRRSSAFREQSTKPRASKTRQPAVKENRRTKETAQTLRDKHGHTLATLGKLLDFTGC
jgi:galactokinase